MQKKSILIVDDSIIIVERMAEILRDLGPGLAIERAHSYSDALAILAHHTPNIVILDINLPDINGIELLRYIKKNHPPATIIMFTNRGNVYYRDLCQRSGADFFVDKSGGFDQMPGIISSVLYPLERL